VLVITGLSITALFWLNLWSRKKIQVWQKGGAHRAEGVHS
jgi:molybdate transport system permease protein